MCGIADYTGYITGKSPPKKWGVISFELKGYREPLIKNSGMAAGQVWYGIPSHTQFSASAILKGIEQLGGGGGNPVLWFQHEFGIWRDSQKFVTMLKDLHLPKIVTFHTLHFQSTKTPSGLRKREYELLQALLPHVDAITVFSHGVRRAITLAFPEYRKKVHIIKHGIHSYPEISRLNRKEAKEKFNDFLLYESELDQATKEALYKQRTFLDSNTVVIGQTGFLSPAKGSELLYTVGDSLQKAVPNKRIAAVRIGSPRDKSQEMYAERLQRAQNGKSNFLLKVWLPQSILPLVQRAFDINFYWPSDCTQSGVLAHALGAGAIVAGRDLEGVGETLKEAGEIVDTDLGHLVLKIQKIIFNPELAAGIEERVQSYAAEFSWENQVRRHYELAEHILARHPFGRPRVSL